MDKYLSLSGLWRKRYTVVRESYKVSKRKIVEVCKNKFHHNRIIDFSEESGQGQAFEMDTNLPGAVIRASYHMDNPVN